MTRKTTKIILDRPLVLIGMMGAGKSSIGARLAKALETPFIDADDEIEKAAQMSIAEIFETHGEAYFRDGERRVIARILGEGPLVLATGGGAFVDPDTRALIKASACSIWLRVPLDELIRRVKRKPEKRPLLKDANLHATMARLLDERSEAYSEAHITIDSEQDDHDSVVKMIIETLGRQPGLDKSDEFA